MGLLLLLTSTLLSSYFHAGSVANAQPSFTINSVTLSIEPQNDVTRETNVTLRCQAIVLSLGHELLSREYTVYKDNQVVYTKTSSTTDDLLYPLPDVRVSNTGTYKCEINIDGTKMPSKPQALAVTGLSQPELRLNKQVVTEGEEVTATCTAPGETGSIYFYFYQDSTTVILRQQVNSNQTEAKIQFSSTGVHRVHCSYRVFISPESFQSEESNVIPVSVKELRAAALLEIFPRHDVYEGDRLDISCTISNLPPGSEIATLYLSKGTKLLSVGKTKVNHSMIALANEPGEFECKLQIGNVNKITTETVSVTELFSVPTLTMHPAEVFQREFMTLICKSKINAPEKLKEEDLTYSLDPSIGGTRGAFKVRALWKDLNYTCAARAKGVVKNSEVLTVRPKVFVSRPKISVLSKPIIGKPFTILCESDNGSLPINYTLVRGFDYLHTTTVALDGQRAVFNVTITEPSEINKYMCEATNSQKHSELSYRLKSDVVEPLRDPLMTVLPDLNEIYEGGHLNLICGTKGSPPVTFKWYREGSDTAQLLHTTTILSNNTDYHIPLVSKKHSGTYYCEAYNHANFVSSDRVTIEVRMALWKKAMIVGFCLLALTVLVLVCVLYFRSKRVRRVDKAAVSVWTKRPSESDADNDEESSVVSNEPDVEYTEVVHPRPVDPARVPLRKGTDTVYSELQNSPHGAADHHDYGSVEYAELNGEQPEINRLQHPEVNSFQDLPEPVD